ncbi:MAG: hypothetical protein ACI87E_000634 [Mariniblastus sp.]|jgi:hypothetical protein
MNTDFIKSRLSLILLGVGVGWLAIAVLGAPPEETGPRRSIERPIGSSNDPSTLQETYSDEIDPANETAASHQPVEPDTGLVPPIVLPNLFPNGGLPDGESSDDAYTASLKTLLNVSFDEHAHDEQAIFEPHGEQVCASGCAISRHPTANLSKETFSDLITRYGAGPLTEDNAALEELLYFSVQTRRLIETEGLDRLPVEHAVFLWDQLAITHAKISIRVKDEAGNVRTWISPTSVPFDRRHVFKMQTNDVQPLVTSGTVKRVGLNHLWTRL